MPMVAAAHEMARWATRTGAGAAGAPHPVRPACRPPHRIPLPQEGRPPPVREKRRRQSESYPTVGRTVNNVNPTASPRRDARRNHERLLVEARALFTERGIDAPLDELAVRAGVGAGTVYRHFASRDALVRELYDTAVSNLHDFAPEILGAESGWRSVELYLERLATWLAESPYLPAVMRRMAELDPGYKPGAEFEDAINGLVARAQAEGMLRSDVTAVDLSVLVDMLGSIGQYGGAYLPYWRRQLTIVLDGLRARPDVTPLPGVGLGFDAFHDMSHKKGPRRARH